MAPPPIKTSLLPNQVNLRPGTARGRGGTRTGSAPVRPPRITVSSSILTSTPAPTNSLLHSATHNGTGTGVDYSQNGDREHQLSDKQRLKVAYAMYLQQGIAALVAQKLNNLETKVSCDKLTGAAIKTEVVDTLSCGIQDRMVRSTVLKKLRDMLTESVHLHAIYKQIRSEFEGKVSTLEELNHALELRFNVLLIQDNGIPSPMENLDEADMSELLEELKTYLEFMDRKGSESDDHSTSSCPQGMINIQFLAKFMEAIKELLQVKEKTLETKATMEGTKEMLLEAMSVSISNRALSKVEKNMSMHHSMNNSPPLQPSQNELKNEEACGSEHVFQ